MSKRDIALYIDDIKSSIGKIEKYTQNISFKDFSNDSKTIDAVVRNLEIVGEAVKNIPKAIKVKHPEIPWKKIIGARNKAIHEYFGIDLNILWETIKEDISQLKEQIERIKL